MPHFHLVAHPFGEQVADMSQRAQARHGVGFVYMQYDSFFEIHLSEVRESLQLISE